MTCAIFEIPSKTRETPDDARGEYLRRYNAKYLALRELLPSISKLGAEMTLRYIEVVANYAASQHTGRFVDGAIENVAFEIGRNIKSTAPRSWHGFSLPDLGIRRDRTILHVATRALAVGGHTRTIRNWIAIDRDSRHLVILIDQPPDIACRFHGSQTMVLPRRAPLMLKAKWLRAVSKRADLVVLHHHPHDIVPVVAFAKGGGPPVAVLNHADHLFWLGPSIADAVINLRRISIPVNLERRGVGCNMLLPIPLQTPSRRLTRTEARNQLRIPDDQVVLLSIGRGDKYVPTDTHDFLSAATQTLDRNSTAHLYVLGLSDQEARAYWANPSHERLHFLGRVDDPSVHQAAADLYLESVPFGSQTALLEAAMHGLALVRSYAPPVDLLATDDDILDGIDVPDSEGQYVDAANDLIRNVDARRRMGELLQKRAIQQHTGDGWQWRLEDVYSKLLSLRHAPKEIAEPDAPATDTDIALSRWNRGNNIPTQPLADELSDLILQFAYERRQERQHRMAFAMLFNFARRHGYSKRICKELAKIPPHWIAARLRGSRP